MIDWTKVVTAEQKAVEANKLLRDRVAAKRYEIETRGFTLNGMKVDTERQSQAMIIGAALAATLDPLYVCNWKTADGFVHLTASELITVATALRNYIQACFDREAAIIQAIENGTYTDDMLTTGWPQ